MGALLVALVIALTLVVKVPAVQTWLVHRVASWLSGELGVRVEVGAVSIHPFSRVVLEGVFIEDRERDTLASIARLEAAIRSFSLSKRHVHVSKVTLEEAVIGVKRYAQPREYNVDFLIDYFSGGGETTTAEPWQWKVDEVQLADSRLRYRDLKYIDKDKGIDWEDIELDGLRGIIRSILPTSGGLSARIDELAFREKSGFSVQQLEARFDLAADSMAFQELTIQTPRSSINGQLTFLYDDFNAFQSFLSDVRWKARFESSVVDFRDLSFFASELEQLNKSLTISGRFSGNVERFKGKDVEISLTDSTYFKGDVTMSGLPDFDETYMEVNARELALLPRDIEQIPSWPFDSTRTITLPSELNNLGQVKFEGRFNGFYTDFVAFGELRTALGYASSDLNLKIAGSDKNTTYKGNIRLFEFDAGRLWNLSPTLGKVTLTAGVEGSGFELKNIQAVLTGRVESAQFYGYTYSNIDLDGQVADRLFTGKVVAVDKNLDFSFAGDVDFRDTLPRFDFTAEVAKADLKALNLSKRENGSLLSTTVGINLIGDHIDNIQGAIDLRNTTYSEGGLSVQADTILLEASGATERSLRLSSDLADMKVQGRMKFSELPKAIQSIATRYIPVLFESESRRTLSQDFSFQVQLKNTENLTNVFLPQLKVARGTSLEGRMDTDLNEVDLHLKSSGIVYEGVALDGINIDGFSERGNLNFNADLGGIAFTDSVRVNQLNIQGFTNRDTASVMIDFNGLDSLKSEVTLGINAGFMNAGYTSLHFNPSKLRVAGRDWSLDSTNFMLVDSSGVVFKNVVFRTGDQEVSFAGVLGKSTSTIFRVGFRSFDMSQANPFLSSFGVQTGGILDGEASFAGAFDQPGMNADLAIQGLQWFGDTIGNADILTEWNSIRKQIDVMAIVTRGGNENIEISGHYRDDGKDGELDFKAVLKKTYVSTFGIYLKGLVSGLGGVASGELYLRGTPVKPELTGKLFLQKISFTIDYLQTSYNLSTDVTIESDRFVFKDVVINDVNGNQAVLNGDIRHKHLDDFRFDLDIAAKRVQVMNTSYTDNSVYYGEAYASGTVGIKGPLDYIVMNIGLRSESGTRILLPLSNPEEVRKSGFITFVSHSDSLATLREPDGPDLSGVELNMDLEITPEARFELIFDSKIGDVIKGSGSGNITMSISPKEDLSMQGEFTIENGDYLFTMQNIINKNFHLKKGGKIRWTGDPYDATIDLSAVYKLRTGLYDLFQDSSFRTLVPVELHLGLKEKLFNPTIIFDIVVLNIDPNTENQVKRLINSEEEKYRQAVSLLVMRRFTAPSEIASRGSTSGASVVGVNAYEMLSNQLSNWASQISNQVNVGVNYRPGDALTSEELEVALSTSLFNDRVTIDGNVGMANAANGTNQQNTSNLIGDFQVEVKASKDGRIRLKAFNRSNNNSLINNLNSPYTQGVGVFYREDFNSFGELLRRYRKILMGSKRKAQLQ